LKTPRVVVIFLAVLVGTLLLATPALAAVSLNPYEEQLVAEINKERAARGLVKLRVNAKLVTAARAHSTDMGRHKFFDHDSPDGEGWSARIVRHGYTRKGCRYWKAGENLYYGAGLSSSPCVVVDAWMRSETHRAVILTKAFRDVGVGAVKTEDGYAGIDGVVWFFTLDLGRRIAR
jgi:uncharacterized protein YkwD